MTRADCTAAACRALRRAEALEPVAAEPVAEELARVRRRIAAGELRRAALAAESAATLAGRLEHWGEAQGRARWLAFRRLANETRELVARLRMTPPRGGCW